MSLEFKDQFVSLHTHSHASRFDGYGTEEVYAKRLNEIGQSAVAMTEHGNLGGLFEQTHVFEKTGAHKNRAGDPIKFIPGCEMYLADDAEARELSPEEKKAIRAKYASKDEGSAAVHAETKRRQSRDHITVWALDDEGLHNLMRLSSWSWLHGYYGKPRIDLKRLRQFSKGLAVSTGCPGGIITSPLRKGDPQEAIRRMKELAETFGDRLYAEIMPHVPAEMPDLASRIVKLAKTYGANIIATQDAHYARHCDATTQEILLCIHTGDKMSNPPGDAPGQRFAFDAHNYWLRTREEMETAFRLVPGLEWSVVQKALDATMAFTERCTAKLTGAKAGSYLVAPDLPPGVPNYDEWILSIVAENAQRKTGRAFEEMPAHYLERLAVEMERISTYGFAPYLVSVWDVIEHCRGAGILVGPGRGSAAGSIVCWLMDITKPDPIEHGLSFDRFIAPLPESDVIAGNYALPDVDTDIQKSRRSEVIDYLREKYGEDRVAQIRTHNTFGGKQALNDCARVNGIPQMEVVPVTSLIVNAVEEESQDSATLKDILEHTEPGRAFAKRYPDVAAQATGLEGQIRAGRQKDVESASSGSQGGGTHAAGVVVAPMPLVDVVPLESIKRKGKQGRAPIIAFDMKAVEKMGLVKQDWLGLEALDWLAQAVKECGADLDAIPYHDPATLKAFTDGRFTGIFQYDTPSARRLCHGFQFKRFSDVAVLTALNRPGPMKSGQATAYIERSTNPALVPDLHPVMERITFDTYGVLIYQEQLVAVALDLCGYSPVEAQKFRKKVAKKEGLSDEEKHFVDGAVVGGMERADAEDLFSQIKDFAAYCFNKSHAVAYARIAWQAMWLKVHHSAAFYAGALAHEHDRFKQVHLAGDARNHGIAIAPPEVSASAEHFAIRNARGVVEIVGSAGDIKGIGRGAAEAVASARPYTSLRSFYRKTRGEKLPVTSKTFELLARATAFRDIFSNQRFLVANAKTIWKMLKKGYSPVVPMGSPYEDYDEDERVRIASEVYPMYLDSRGIGIFDLHEKRLRDETGRTLFTPGDPLLADRHQSLVFGQLAAHRVFDGDEGVRTARVQLLSSMGDELMAKVPAEVLLDYGHAITKDGEHLVAVVTQSQYGAQVQAMWNVKDVFEPRDAIAAHLLRPERTKPRDPSRTLAIVAEEGVVEVEGVIVRKKIHLDKRHREMATVGILASNGYLPILVFAKIWAEWPRRKIVLGAKLRTKVGKLDGGGAAARGKPILLESFAQEV